MASEEILRKTIHNADGKPFAKHKNIEGSFVTEGFELFIDEVQGDRMGHSRMRVRVPMRRAGFPEDSYSNESRRIALEDLIARRFWESARTHARSNIPKTDGGIVYMPRPGQEILDRGSVRVTEHFVEASFTADLPSKANKVDEMSLIDLIFGRISLIVSESMLFSAYKRQKLYGYLEVAENADHIRANLNSLGLAAFIGIGSILPRREDDLAPMVDAQPFDCDDSLKVTIDVPNGPSVIGMGIRKGFTAITGASGSGKSTLADAVFSGIYNHIPGDGRELVIADPNAVYVMSEAERFSDGKRVSGPESEIIAASEAMELGSKLLILDEEYSCPCVIRRSFPRQDDDIAPLGEMGKGLLDKGVSLLIVTGDREAVCMADSAIIMKGFKAEGFETERIESSLDAPVCTERYPVSKGVSFEKGRKEVSTSAPSIRTVEIGEYKVSAPVTGFFDNAQTRSAADAIAIARDIMDGSRSLKEVCEAALSQLKNDDIENGTGMHHAYCRPIDVAAVLSRHPQMLFIRK